MERMSIRKHNVADCHESTTKIKYITVIYHNTSIQMKLMTVHTYRFIMIHRIIHYAAFLQGT